MFRWLTCFTLLLALSTECLFATNKNLSDRDYFIIAEQMEIDGKTDNANQVFYELLHSSDNTVSLDSAFKLAQVAMKAERFKDASLYYRWMLQQNPNLPQVRFELALCYMKLGKWQQADYQLRLALAAPDIPIEMQKIMFHYRYLIRQNKNWNVWFNFGAAPDNNINNAIGGTECVNTMFGPMCRDLSDPESAIGYNFSLGGNYEFKLSDHWRWKSDAFVYSNIYDISDYDDLYLSVGSGPRYIWNRGDVWLAGVWNRRWYGWERYNWSVGAKLDLNYDFTRKLSGGLYLQYLNNSYDLYDDFLSGDTYSAQMRFSYSFNARLYSMLRVGLTREVANAPEYSYWQPGFGIGIGAELPWGFHVYGEPYFYWTAYDDDKWVVHNGTFSQITERDFTQRYSISISNNKFDIWGFVPTVVLGYTHRDSNIWQREFDKFSAEFTMRQRF